MPPVLASRRMMMKMARHIAETLTALTPALRGSTVLRRPVSRTTTPTIPQTIPRLRMHLSFVSQIISTDVLTSILRNFDDLLHVLRSDGVNTKDLTNFSARKAEQLLDDHVPLTGAFSALDDWQESSVEIPLPKTRSNHKTEAATPKYSVSGVIHCRLLSLIQTIVEDQNSRFAHKHHWYGHEMYWNPPHLRAHATLPPLPPRPGSTFISIHHYTSDETESPPPAPIRVYTDCYNSNAML